MNQHNLILSQDWNPIIPKSIDSTIEEAIQEVKGTLVVHILYNFLQDLANHTSSLQQSYNSIQETLNMEKWKHQELMKEYNKIINDNIILKQQNQQQLENVINQHNSKLDSLRNQLTSEFMNQKDAAEILKQRLQEQCLQQQQKIDEQEFKINQLCIENLELKTSIKRQEEQYELNKTPQIYNIPQAQQNSKIQLIKQNPVQSQYQPKMIAQQQQNQSVPQQLNNDYNQSQGQQEQIRKQQQQQSEIKTQKNKISIKIIPKFYQNPPMQQMEYQQQRFSTDMPIINQSINYSAFNYQQNQVPISNNQQIFQANDHMQLQAQGQQNQQSIRQSEYDNKLNCVHCNLSCPTYVQLPCQHKYHQDCLENIGKLIQFQNNCSAQCICNKNISTKFYSKNTQSRILSIQAAQIFLKYRLSYQLMQCQDCEFFYQQKNYQDVYCPNCLKYIQQIHN